LANDEYDYDTVDPCALLSSSVLPPDSPQVIKETIPIEPNPCFPVETKEQADDINENEHADDEHVHADDEPVHLVDEDNVVPQFKYETSSVVDYDRSNLDKRHVIIPFDELIKFIDTNFVCKQCSNSRSSFQRQTRGIATSINWFCACHSGGSIKARIRTNEKNKVETDRWKNARWTSLLPTASYELNLRFVLALQQCGGGEADSAVHAGMLDLAVSPFARTWQQVEEEIAIVEVEVGKKIVDMNIQLEIKKTKERQQSIVVDRLHNRSLAHLAPREYLPLTTPESVDLLDKKQVHHLICKSCRPVYAAREKENEKRTAISVQGDCRWDQRKGGRAYNSDSGTHLIVGNESLKTVAVECLSRRCSKCEHNKIHPLFVCPKNYEGSSKGMEAEGALRNVRLLYNEKNVFIETFVMDDDSSTKSILRHSWKLMVDSGILDSLDWPRTASGAKKKDSGQLPLLHPIIDFLADKNHRVRTYAKYFFLLAHKKRSVTCCTPNDAERMKRNFAYSIHMYRHDSFSEFKKAAKAVLEHHFNNHVFCGEWCPANKWKEDEKQLRSLKYRCKVKHTELYEQMSTIHNTFTDVWNLQEIYHEYHSNKCESLNGFITKFLPKHKHYCRTIINRARTYLAIGIDSVGYNEYYGVLWKMLGVSFTSLTNEHHQRLDRTRKKKSKYDQSEKTKKARRQKLNDKLRAASELLMKDKKKGKTYGSNIAGPQVDGMALDGSEVIDLVETTTKKKSPPSICGWCHKVGHATKNHSKCMLTVKPRGKHYRKENTDAPRKFCTNNFCYVSLFWNAGCLTFWYCKRS
jgi:hypothetical protein